MVAQCEWQCGNWCAPPLPDWRNELECIIAAKTCALQVVSCFKYAGWPNTIDCFDFQRWCGKVEAYCSSDCTRSSCGKVDCFDKINPCNGNCNCPTVETSVYPCLAATTMTQATATPDAPVTSCPPEPTNICTQATNNMLGYGPDKPVGGIAMPVVSCNDQRDDFNGKPFKFYTDANSYDCPSFAWQQRPNVCKDACNEQYQQCRDTYVNSCGKLGWKGTFHKRLAGESDEQLERRWAESSTASCAVSGNALSWAADGADAVSCWGFGGNTPEQAEIRCKAQWSDCLVSNKGVNPGDMCSQYCR